jgi:glucosyl-dolichyl phosphate glucuronosyltransferase
VARRVGTDAALSTERTYVTRILPRAVIRELSAGRPASAAAIVTALLCTTAGFARGAASAAAARPRTGARPPAAVAVAEPYQARCA